MKKQAQLKGYAVLAGVFALGAVAGGGASYAYVQREVTEMLAPDERGFDERRLRALKRELGLSAEQRDRIREIRERHRSERRELMERCGEPLAEHDQKVESEIRAVLTPEQQARYDELREKRGGRPPLGGRGRPGRRPPRD